MYEIEINFIQNRFKNEKVEFVIVVAQKIKKRKHTNWQATVHYLKFFIGMYFILNIYLIKKDFVSKFFSWFLEFVYLFK